MKTSLTYGFLIALAGLVLSLLLFFTGYHTDVEKMQSGVMKVLNFVPLVISIVGLALAMREARTQRPAEAAWGYGSAFGAGVLTALFASIFGAVLSYIYFALINPNMGDVVYQVQVAAMEAKNVPADQIDKAEPIMRKMLSPVMMTCFGMVIGFVISVVVSLIVAIFFRERPAAPLTEPPAIA